MRLVTGPMRFSCARLVQRGWQLCGRKRRTWRSDPLKTPRWPEGDVSWMVSAQNQADERKKLS